MKIAFVLMELYFLRRVHLKCVANIAFLVSGSTNLVMAEHPKVQLVSPAI